jgi:hypothetical protein
MSAPILLVYNAETTILRLRIRIVYTVSSKPMSLRSKKGLYPKLPPLKSKDIEWDDDGIAWDRHQVAKVEVP